MLIMHGFNVDAGEDEDVKMMAGPNVAEQDIGATVVHCGPPATLGAARPHICHFFYTGRIFEFSVVHPKHCGPLCPPFLENTCYLPQVLYPNFFTF